MLGAGAEAVELTEVSGGLEAAGDPATTDATDATGAAAGGWCCGRWWCLGSQTLLRLATLCLRRISIPHAVGSTWSYSL